jgi:superfamily I DNA/RNA helicase
MHGKQARAHDLESTVAVLYRINAQSRAIEDSLMREAIPYKIIGGVRFYGRKEIKDALAYLKLIINPHDDVSVRRVINVPARGVGKGVMDALQAIDADAVVADAPPLLRAGCRRRRRPDRSEQTRLRRRGGSPPVERRRLAARGAISC